MKRPVLILFALLALTAANAQTAKSVIYVYLDGGASQTDTFDPKPEAGYSYTGKYKTPIETNVPGIQIGPRLVNLARIADRYSLLRGMYNGTNAHETGHYRTLTGDMTGRDIVYPSYGAMIAYKTREHYTCPLFPYICITEASTRFNEAGFLPSYYKPYDTGGAPAGKWFDVSGIVDHSMPDDLLRARRELLGTLSKLGRPVEQTPEVRRLDSLREASWSLVAGARYGPIPP